MPLGRVRVTDLASRRARVLLVAVVVLASAFAIPTASSHVPTPETGTAPAILAAPTAHPTGPARTTEPSEVAASAADLALSSASVGSVVRTVFPGFNTSLPGSFTSSVSSWQVGTPTYVPVTNTIWFPQRSVAVPGYPTPTIAPAAVFNLLTGKFDQFVANLSNASALAYDPADQDVYATLPASNAVAVVNPRTGAIVDPSIPVGSAPDALVIDSDTNLLFVANSGSSDVTVINILHQPVFNSTVLVESDPVSLAFDPHDELVFVANAGSHYVSVINATNPGGGLTPIPIVYGPASSIAYSPISGNLVATDPSSDYATIINASIEGVQTSVEVGKGLLPAATSANGTEFALANESGSDVVLLNSTSGAQIGKVALEESNATELLLDPQSEDIYCWTSGGRILEELNLSSKVATPAAPTTSPALLSIAFLSEQSRVYVSSANGSLIYGLDPLRFDQSVPIIPDASTPLSIVADPVAGRIFIGTSTGLGVYNVTTDTFTLDSHLSGMCSQLVLDRSDNLLWLSNSLQGVVAVNLTKLTVKIPTTLSVLPGAVQGIAIDSSDSRVFVLAPNGTVAVLYSPSGEELYPGINVGPNVTSLVFDPADDQVYAAGDRVTMINGATLAVDTGPALLGSPHRVLGEVYEPSRKGVYIASVGALAGKQGTVTVFDGSSVSASEASTVEIPVGEDPDAFGVVSAGNGGGVGSAMVWVANELSGTISVIASPPRVTSFGASPSTVDLGFPTSILVTYEGGAGSSTVTYYGLPPGCSSSDVSELNCTPTASGLFLLAVNLTDSFGISVNVTTSLTVLRSLAVHSTLSVSTFPYIDAGVPLVGAASAANGLPPYSYRWSFGDGNGATGADASHAYANPGVYVVTTEVQDATGASNNSSAYIVVVARPTVGISLTPGNVTDVNGPVTIDATVTGGVGASQQTWALGDGTSANGSTVSHSWTRPGNYTVSFGYTDALGVTANASAEITVHPSLTATFSSGDVSSSNPASPATPVAFTASISGGTPPYTVSWWFGDGSMATGLSVSHPYASTGTYAVNVTLADAVGGSVRTNLSVTVAQSSSSGGGITSPGSGFGAGVFLGLLIGGVVAAVVLFALGPRKGSRSPGGPVSPYVPP